MKEFAGCETGHHSCLADRAMLHLGEVVPIPLLGEAEASILETDGERSTVTATRPLAAARRDSNPQPLPSLEPSSGGEPVAHPKSPGLRTLSGLGKLWRIVSPPSATALEVTSLRPRVPLDSPAGFEPATSRGRSSRLWSTELRGETVLMDGALPGDGETTEASTGRSNSGEVLTRPTAPPVKTVFGA